MPQQANLHFSREEFAARLQKTRDAMNARQIDCLVVVDPSNMAWLTGYDGWSFYTHQCVIVRHDAEPVWWGRGIDAAGALRTCYIDADNIIGYPDHFVQSTERHPMDHLSAWLEEATRKAVQRHPNAMTLATVSASGKPSARVVLLKALSVDEGFAVFHTHYGSRKSVEMTGNPAAAAVMHWDTLGRQVRLEGTAVQSPSQESDDYFATRSWRSQLNAWVSEQSQSLNDPSDLLDRARERAQEFNLPDPVDSGSGEPEPDVPALDRPTFWGGYRLWLDSVELWQQGAARIHDRAEWRRPLEQEGEASFAAGPWTSRRLQP